MAGVQRATCARCGCRFATAENLGTWRCRRHAKRPVLTLDRGLVYPCCNLSVSEMAAIAAVRFAARRNAGVTAADLRGCVPVDHIPLGMDTREVEFSFFPADFARATARQMTPVAAADDTEEDPDRDLFAVLILPAYLPVKVDAMNALARVPGAPTSISLREARTAASLIVAIAGANGERRDTDLRARLIEFCERTYRDPRYHRSLTDYKTRVDSARAFVEGERAESFLHLAMPHVLDLEELEADEMDTDALNEERAHLRREVPATPASHDDEAMAYALLRDEKPPQVPLVVLRRAAPWPDPAVLARIQAAQRIMQADGVL